MLGNVLTQHLNADGSGTWTDAAGVTRATFDSTGELTSINPDLKTQAAWLQVPVYIVGGVGLLIGLGAAFAYSKRK